jgi:murein DD-endopeptidase MepM/ murein hydrolase activator NlpD
MSPVAFLFASFIVAQGQALQVGYPDEPGLRSIAVEWSGREVPFVQAGEAWFTVLGVDLDTPSGSYPIEVVFTYDDGRQRLSAETIEVEGKSFPTTELTVEPGFVQLSPENQERAARESREIGAVYATLTPGVHWQESFEVPIPGATGGRNFGHRRVFNGEPRAPHSGADLSATTGTEIHASNSGRVVLAKDFFFNGNAVFIDHGLGVYTMYLHLSEILVGVGELVERGQVVGLAGATGRVTGPHLHWGARILDARVDPFSLLTLTRDAGGGE